MVKEKMFDFCTSCRKETSYKICKKTVQKVIKGKSYEFEIAVAFCNECGKEMDIPSLLDSNVKSIDEQYRQIEGLISVDDIQKIMDIYNIGKEPLSIALGVGETTITRYLSGQMPSKEHSNILLRILSDKEIWLDKYYPVIKDRLLVYEDKSKADTILQYCKEHGINVNDIVYVDDVIPFLREAERKGIKSFHISSFLDWDYQ